MLREGYSVRQHVKEIDEKIRKLNQEISDLKYCKEQAYKNCPHTNARVTSDGIWNCKSRNCPDCGFSEAV